MIKLIKSSFHNEQSTKKALAEFILREEILSMSKQCKLFEESFAKKQQRKFAIYVSNGSVANFLLIQSMLNEGLIKKGDKIGFSALTWPTNVMPLIQLGLEPVAIDCEVETLNISPKQLRSKIDGLRGLFITNVLGFCDDLEQVKQICREKNVILIEDNCESLGSEMNDTLLGNFGLASTFSFFVGHHLSTIEGGMVCTDDKGLYDQMLMARAHGWDRNLNENKQSQLREENNINNFYANYTFYDLASNFRPSEINGFIGNVQINYWDEIVQKRVSNFHHLQSALDKNNDFYHYNLGHMSVISNFAMPVVCKSEMLAEAYRDIFQKALVEIRPIIAGNIVRQPFYKKYVSATQPMPNSDLVHSQGFYFGNNPDMTIEEIEVLCGLLSGKV